MKDENAKKLSVLVVDDDELDRESVKRLVRNLGATNFILHEAENWTEAYETLKDAKINLILLDYYLPDSNAVESLEVIQKEFGHIPVIVMTGRGDEEMVTEVIRAGASDYLAKDSLDAERLFKAISYVLSLFRSKNEQKRLNEELVRSNEELQHFASRVAHDLKLPISSIEGYLGLITGFGADQLTGEQKEYCSKLVSVCSELQEFIQELLEYSVIKNKKVEKTKVNLNEVISGILNSYETVIKEKNAKIDIRACPTVLGEKILLKQLLQNLIGNALKYTPPNKPPEITVSTEFSLDGSCFLIVEDKGIGFDPSKAEEIFQPLKRLNGAKKYSGTGLGLAYCHRIVTQHGWKISASSKPGEGSKFILSIPLEMIVREKVDTDKPSSPEAQKAA